MCVLQIPYRTVEVSPLTKKQLKWSDYHKVPVLLLDGEPVTDSTAIITRLAAEVAEQERQQHASQAQASSSSWKKLLGGGTRTEEVKKFYRSRICLVSDIQCLSVTGEWA